MMKTRLLLTALLIFWSLLITADLYALMPAAPAEKEVKETPISAEGLEEASKEDAAIKNKIKEEIERIKQEKKRIIEKAKKKKPTVKRRPFEVSEKRVRYVSPPQLSETAAVEKHDILVRQKTTAVVMTILLLAGLTYLLYKLILKRMSK